MSASEKRKLTLIGRTRNALGGGELTRKAGEQAERHRKLGLMEKLQEKDSELDRPQVGRAPDRVRKGGRCPRPVQSLRPPTRGPDTRNPMAGDPHRSRNRNRAALRAGGRKGASRPARCRYQSHERT